MSRFDIPTAIFTVRALDLTFFPLAFGFSVFLVPVDRPLAASVNVLSTNVGEEDDSETTAPSPTCPSQFLPPGFLNNPLNIAAESVILDSAPQEHTEGYLPVTSTPPLSLHELQQDHQAVDSTRTTRSLQPVDIVKAPLWGTMWPLVVVDYSPGHVIDSEQVQAPLYESVFARLPGSESEGTASVSVCGLSQVSAMPSDLSDLKDSTPQIELHFRQKPGSWEYVAQSQNSERWSKQWLVMKRQGNPSEFWEFKRSGDPPVDPNFQKFCFTFAQVTGVLDGAMFERGHLETCDVELVVPRKTLQKRNGGLFTKILLKP